MAILRWLCARVRLAVVLSILLAIASLACARHFASTASWTIDERDHLRWSERLVYDGITERRSQETFNSKTPIMVPGAVLSHGVSDAATQRRLARVPSLVWLGLLYAVTAWLGRRWFAAGALAAGFLALDPNPIAHGALATVDVAFAVATLVLLEAIRSAVERPSLATGLALGAAVALALTAKFTALVILGPALLVPLIARWARRDRPALAATATAVAAACACAWVLVAATYGFHGIGASAAWESAPFRALERFAGPALAIFPVDFLSGIDSVLADDRRQTVNVVMDGISVRHGLPSYFAWCAGLKTPLALLAATIVGIGLGMRRGAGALQALSIAVVIASAGVYFSFFFRTQVGYRYVLMLVPLAYLLAARGWTMALGPAKAGGVLGVVAFFTLVETVPYRAHPLAFTNAIVSDKRDAFRYLADSNLDWGQDSDAIVAWVAREGAVRDPYHLLPGTNVFGASLVAGVWFPDRYEHLRTTYRTPDEAPFYSHVVWKLDAREFDSYLDEHRAIGGTSRPTRPCERAGAWDRIPRSAPGTLVCFDAPSGADLVLEPGASTTIAVWDGACASREPEMFRGQTVWFRFAPGTHALCVRGGPAEFRIERGAATLGPAREGG
jgi:hypothetical protein